MATTIAIGFPWGRYHATPWGRNVNEGAVDWPPSTWRLLRSLYAVWKTRAPDLDETVVHSVLGALVGPPEYELPDFRVAHTRHYMPDRAHGTDKVLDAWVTTAQDAEVLITWPVDLEEAQQQALARLLDLLPYLGRAESICVARVVPSEDRRELPLAFSPSTEDDDRERVRVLVPEPPLDVDHLTVRTTTVRSQGRIDPVGATWVDYPRPIPAPRCPTVRRVATVAAVRWRIATNALPARTAALSMTTALRRAVIDHLTDEFGDRSSPPNVHGKDDAGNKLVGGHQHAHFFALTSDPEVTGTTRIDTLVMWIPGEVAEDQLVPLHRLQRLWARQNPKDFRACRLGLEGVGTIEEVAPELISSQGEPKGSRCWESYTPFAPPRHGRKNQDPWIQVEKDVRRELASRGFPTPESVSHLAEAEAHLSPSGGWLDFRRNRPDREKLRDARRATGVRIEFAEPTRGPIAIGALSHFGLGLFLPVPE